MREEIFRQASGLQSTTSRHMVLGLSLGYGYEFAHARFECPMHSHANGHFVSCHLCRERWDRRGLTARCYGLSSLICWGMHFPE